MLTAQHRAMSSTPEYRLGFLEGRASQATAIADLQRQNEILQVSLRRAERVAIAHVGSSAVTVGAKFVDWLRDTIDDVANSVKQNPVAATMLAFSLIAVAGWGMSLWT